jgi:hypothetical protein
MGFDQKGPTIFYVRQNESCQWNVFEEGYEKPLTFFTEKEDAVKYANDIAGTKKDASVQVDE